MGALRSLLAKGTRRAATGSMGKRWLSLLGLLLLLGATGCRLLASPGALASNERTLVLFAASSLHDAFDELADEFEREHPEITVVRNFAGSSQLAVQLEQGAEADIFAPANVVQMQRLVDASLVAEGEPVAFAGNSLVVIVPRGNPASIRALEDLTSPDLLLVLASPDVPVRAYTDAWLAQLTGTLAEAVYQNVASEEPNVRQIVAKIALGEGDAGIVYASDVTPDVSDRIEVVPVAPTVPIPIAYPIARLAESPQPALGAQFMALVTGRRGQMILAKWGFQAPPETATLP